MLIYLHGQPEATGVIRQQNADFEVEEQIDFTPTESGEHLWLWVEKEGTNTQYVAEQLAKFAGIAANDVSVAGQKDRHAVTRQWFCLRFAGKPEPAWSTWSSPSIRILKQVRHAKKLRTGGLTGNRFWIRLREVSDLKALQARFAQICNDGVPNYFGEQRFGREGQNLARAEAMFAGKRVKRQQRSLYLSAVRSHLFNQFVDARLRRCQATPVSGDVVMLAGNRSFFTVCEWDESLLARLRARDILLSAPLWGRGNSDSAPDIATLEAQIVAEQAWMAAGLEAAGLEQARRPLLLFPEQATLTVDATSQSALIEMVLPKGCFMTSVLRELLQYEDASRQHFE
ncbi:MAG: tRNA pseudouridine(13) synthase TruD [Shewanellaceae bacterium]|nr:tRNA pseudouridine(13) synthase TruD [Shewanellaceae bacterium]